MEYLVKIKNSKSIISDEIDCMAIYNPCNGNCAYDICIVDTIQCPKHLTTE